jgi:hypothetical protein
MILADRWARDHNYAAGFPDFEQAGKGNDEVLGVRCIKSDAVADIQNINASELGNPKDFTDCFKAVDTWCEHHGNGAFKTGYPTGEQRNRHGRVSYRIVLLKPGTVEGKAWPDKELKL